MSGPAPGALEKDRAWSRQFQVELGHAWAVFDYRPYNMRERPYGELAELNKTLFQAL